MGAGGAAADALREQLDTALAEKAAALKDVEYLSAQLQSLLDKRGDHNGEVWSTHLVRVLAPRRRAGGGTVRFANMCHSSCRRP